MKATLLAKPLQTAAASAARLAPKKPIIPVTAGVRLTLEGERLGVEATDLDMWSTVRLAARGDQHEPGSAIVSAEGLAGALRGLNDEAEVRLALDPANHVVRISSGRSRSQLKLIPQDWVTVDEAGLDCRLDVDGASLAALIDAAGWAADENRPGLSGPFLHMAEEAGAKRLRLVSADGVVLALADMPWPDGATLPKHGAEAYGRHGFILPEGAVQAWRRVAADAAGPCSIRSSERLAKLVTTAEALTSRLVDGFYPDYERLLTTDEEVAAEVGLDGAELAHAVKRVAAFAERRDKLRVVFVDVAEGLVTLSGIDDGGEAEEELDADYDGEPFGFAVNPVLLAAVAERCGDQLLWRITPEVMKNLGKTELGPKHDGADGMRRRFLLMTMKRKMGT